MPVEGSMCAASSCCEEVVIIYPQFKHNNEKNRKTNICLIFAAGFYCLYSRYVITRSSLRREVITVPLAGRRIVCGLRESS